MKKAASKAKRAAKKALGKVDIPGGGPGGGSGSGTSSGASSTASSPLKTPADEGIAFFESFTASDSEGGKMGTIAVYEVRLDADGGPSKETSYIRLPPAYTPYIVRVSLDAGTPASKNGVFKTNFPLDGGKFERSTFVERKLPTDFSKPIAVDLPISHAGAFCYWVEYDSPDSAGERIKGREGYFNIDPILRTRARLPIVSSGAVAAPESEGLGKEPVNLPLDGLSILTVVSKWMGPLSAWRAHFSEASERGYTMLHYTPLQARGDSGSPYSIAGQDVYDSELFEAGAAVPSDGGREEVEKVLKVASEEFGLLSLTDVVLNHTASDSKWLRDHPEAGYSPSNTPHLAPAFELDSAILDFSASLASRGLPTSIASSGDIDTLLSAFAEHLKTLNLWQYYVLDATAEKANITIALTTDKIIPWSGHSLDGKSVVEIATAVRDAEYVEGLGALAKRFGVRVESARAAGVVKAAFPQLENDAPALAEAWSRVVDVLNVPLYEEWEADTKAALEQIKGRVTYTRLDDHGPKLGPISRSAPLVEPYFTRLAPTPDADPLVYSVANNGWIWNANPLQNFALHPSKAYLRREVIVWGDCVKLRYGSSASDNPWLWEYMTKYVTDLARTFDGFRIDNCHSTPLHVGVAMLDAARVARPDLYVCAELFTGSEEMDTMFVSRLGINSLIREAGNAWDPKEFSRLLYRHGVGKPIGSMDVACTTSNEELPPPTGKGPTRPCTVIPHNGSAPHALFYDLTHDNETYSDKRTAEDALSTAALVAFSFCATGSVKGFDDLYPKLLDLVGERRKYELTNLGEKSGISKAKRIVNKLHTQMVLEKYEEGHVHQENDYIVMHRVQPSTQKGYILVAHTAFNKGNKDRGFIDPIKLRRTKAKFLYGATIEVETNHIKDPSTLTGLPSTLKELPAVVAPQGLDGEGPYTEIVVPESFPPGSIMLFETEMVGVDADLETFCAQGASEAFGSLDLIDLNVVLHRADGEERDATGGEIGAYDVPGLGKLTYCGLEGWMHPLRHIMRHNDLGHPLCGHLREGAWAFDYVTSRLTKQIGNFPNLAAPAKWFEERFARVKESVPPFLRPKYFAIITSTAYKAARRTAIEQMSNFVSSGHSFTQDLALCAVQMHGLVQSASLDPGKPTPSLAAGLPHFAAGWARCWGRDVFISLRGLFLTTGNFAGARRHILAFASTLKHGLIPNLLDSVRNPRYNSRDSPWWMAQNIQDYVLSAPEGVAFLEEKVKRRFPADDSWVAWDDPKAYAYESTIAEIIQEILQRHASGIAFREYNAGPNLDMQMSAPGFDIETHVDWKTGLIHGGNEHNCGTWMDKMGESTNAGTKGKPGTPRDGVPVEITGLLKSTLRWVAELAAKGKFPFKGVDAEIDGQKRLVTYQEWNDLLQANFERSYYVPLDPAADSEYAVRTDLVNRRGIYKDVVGSGPSREWSDYQFRPNFPIAMTVAPELFDPAHALGALKLADTVLRGPLGMRTLDPADLQYRPYYDNANDGTDAAIAKGLNYHQGPEWGWPAGYFLRAYLHFDTLAGTDRTETLHHLHRRLLPYVKHIQADPWRGIPELTNKDGELCGHSCNTQAWSASCLLDFLEEVHKLSASAVKA